MPPHPPCLCSVAPPPCPWPQEGALSAAHADLQTECVALRTRTADLQERLEQQATAVQCAQVCVGRARGEGGRGGRLVCPSFAPLFPSPPLAVCVGGVEGGGRGHVCRGTRPYHSGRAHRALVRRLTSHWHRPPWARGGCECLGEWG